MRKEQWLAHLPNEVMLDARDNKLCSYTIALEAWRRGLEITFHSDLVRKSKKHFPGFLFTISDGNQSYRFYKARGPKVSRNAVVNGGNKFTAKKIMGENGLPVPKGELFKSEASDEAIVQFAEEIGYPVVLKPLGGAQGKGVISNIGNAEYLRDSIKYVRKDLNCPNVILEKHVTGEEYRIFVLEDQVLAVLNRIPANIIGDGKHTIKQLIGLKNNERKKNPRLYNCLIKIDFEIKNVIEKSGYTLESVPAIDEKVYLRTKSNISTGGDSVEMTDEFPEDLKQLAVEALKCIPDFPHGGVDMMVDYDLPKGQGAHIIELSPTPQIGSLLFPMEGKACDIPAALVDYYFPNTKEKRNANANLYFNFASVLEPIVNKTAKEVTVLPCPQSIEKQLKYTVSGKVQDVGYRQWIRKFAIENELNGYVQNRRDGTVIVCVAGTEEAVTQFKKYCGRGPRRAKVESVKETAWDRPVKIGFEIKQTPKKTVKKPVRKTKPIAKPKSFPKRVVGKLKRMLKA